MKKLLSMTLLTAAMLSMLTVGAQAADYDFVTDGTPEYYGSTSYEGVYGSQYNYGGPNVVDSQDPGTGVRQLQHHTDRHHGENQAARPAGI